MRNLGQCHYMTSYYVIVTSYHNGNSLIWYVDIIFIYVSSTFIGPKTTHKKVTCTLVPDMAAILDLCKFVHFRGMIFVKPFFIDFREVHWTSQCQKTFCCNLFYYHCSWDDVWGNEWRAWNDPYSVVNSFNTIWAGDFFIFLNEAKNLSPHFLKRPCSRATLWLCQKD